MAYIEDGRLHEVTAPEFKDIAKDFASQLRRVCPELKQTAALDVFSNLHYPDLSFASAVPMIESAGTARPLSVSPSESDLLDAIDRCRPKTRELLSSSVDLAGVLAEWSAIVRAVFEDRTVRDDDPVSLDIYDVLGDDVEPEPEEYVPFSMLLAVGNGQRDRLIERVCEAMPEPGSMSSDDVARLLARDCQIKDPGAVERAGAFFLDGQVPEGCEYYLFDQDNPMGIRLKKHQSPFGSFKGLTEFALFPVHLDRWGPLPDYPGAYLVGEAIEQYELLGQYRGKHRLANTFFRHLDDIVPELLHGNPDLIDASGGSTRGWLFLHYFGTSTMLKIMAFQCPNGVFITKFSDVDLMPLLFPVSQIEIGDLFVLDATLSPGGRRPELFEVVGKTRARVRLRSIEYEMEDAGSGPLGTHRCRLFPKSGCYVSSDVITKGVSGSSSDERNYRATFKAFDQFGQNTTQYATHYTRRRALTFYSVG